MYHPGFKGNHYLMGQKMGNIFKRANATFPVNLDRFQKQFGKESGILLHRFFPEAASEIKGITDTIGYDNELFTSWMMCMGCCLDIDNDNSVEVRGCTAFSFIHGRNVYYGRDNDLPPFLKSVSKSVYYQPENGNRFILNTSSFINGEEGMNDNGLVVAMTFVVPELNEIKPGFNSVFIVRYLLEKCKSVNEALDALNNLPIASSCNILLADKSGKMIVAECNPCTIHLRYPEKNMKGDDFIVTVNHFTSDVMREHDASNRNVFLSEIRYETAYGALMNADYNDGVNLAMRILGGKLGFMCQYDKELNFETIWSSVFDISNGKIYRAEDNPAKTKFIEDKRLSGK
jgi:predicted choloylglycine hydrolase